MKMRCAAASTHPAGGGIYEEGGSDGRVVRSPYDLGTVYVLDTDDLVTNAGAGVAHQDLYDVCFRDTVSTQRYE